MIGQAFITRVAPALVLATALFAPACHSPEPREPDAGLTPPITPPQPPDLGKAPPRISVEVYRVYMPDGIHQACGGPDPFFDYDSAKADNKQAPTMQVLAQCMMSGPLQGKSIKLIGRADPRGTTDYNDQLGMKRAERVKQYLVTQGVASDRVITMTAGKDDAKPDPSDWPADRRVDIQLVK